MCYFVCLVSVKVFIFNLYQNEACRWLAERNDELRARAQCPLVRRVILPQACTNFLIQNLFSLIFLLFLSNIFFLILFNLFVYFNTVPELTCDTIGRCMKLVTGAQLVLVGPAYHEPYTSTQQNFVRVYHLLNGI